ncbi:DNA internalization-related competence protein ComEC/Rec2 [Granulicatella sp. 20925_1_28]|uniref:DNA internalization-related competence protein ComEC/Rec2 n=1 Tax=Granulicatella sp. 20925_1_28 TaxID=3003686 RepID=UPI00352D3AEA
MSYWILAVLVASSIVVFEGAVAWWIVPLCIIVVAWKRGQENWKRVLGIVLCVAIGMRLFLYIREVTHPSFMVDDAIHGQLVLNPNQLKVNGDLVTGTATLEAGTKHEKVFFYYVVESESEQQAFLQLHEVVRVSVEGAIEEIEHARNKGNFDAKNYYLSLGVLHALKVERMNSSMKPVSGFWSFVEHLRSQLLQVVRTQKDSRIKQYTGALLLADRSGFSEEEWEQYKQLGLLHLLAISGLHISLMVACIERLCWRSGITREKTRGLLVLFVVLYGFVIGWNISGTRAIGMVLLGVLSKPFIKKRGSMQMDCLLWMAIASILVWPGILLNVAFQLSYGLTVIIIFLSKWQRAVLPRIRANLWVPIGMSLIALPLLCQYFFYWNALSILLTALFSVLFEMLLFPLLTAYLVAVLLGLSSLIDLLTTFGEFILSGVSRVLTFCQQLSFTKFTLGIWDKWEVILFLTILIVVGILFEQRKMTIRKGIVCIIALLALLIEVPYHWGTELVMVDVGQGDSILLLAPGWNQATLIDTGGLSDFKQKEAWRHRKKKDQGITTVVPALQAEGLSELSQVMLSHGDEDHVGNLKTIAKHLTIRQLIIGKGMEKIPLMQEMKKRYPKTQWRLVLAGDEWKWNETTWKVLWPKDLSHAENEDSILALVTVMKQTILLTGDASEKVEEAVVRAHPNLQFSILKVGHHGSRTSSGEALLKLVQPRVAFISCGKHNHYGHPSPETLARLKATGAIIFRTDQDGQIRLQFTREKLEVTTRLTKRKKELKQ